MDLSEEAQLQILEEIAELPPFGFYLTFLIDRLAKFHIDRKQLQTFLEQYYDMNEWKQTFETHELKALRARDFEYSEKI